MTLKQLYEQISALNSQHIDANTPLVQDGKEVDLQLSLNDDLTVKVEKVVPDFESPFSGGPVVEEWVTQNVTYRGTELSVHQRQYKCVDTGNTFCTAELEEDALWEIVRKYCEKKGISVFDLMKTHYEKDNVQE